MIKNNALVGILFLVCCFGLANASHHAAAANKSGPKVPVRTGQPPARPPKPVAQSTANAGVSRSVAITIAGSAASSKGVQTTDKSKGNAPTAATAGASLHYQQSDREAAQRLERSGRSKTGHETDLRELTGGVDDDADGESDDVEAGLLSNARSSGSLKMSHSDIAKQLAAKFPNYFSSAAEIEKHVAELADSNPVVHEKVAHCLSSNVDDKSRTEILTSTRKHGKSKKQQSNAAENFLSKQMMQFLKRDRDNHAENSKVQTINSNWWKRSALWSGTSSLACVLWWGFMEYSKATTSCK